MMTYIVVEGVSDEILLSQVLANEIHQDALKVRAAGGESSAISKARTLLAIKEFPVILWVDADSYDDSTITSKRGELAYLLSQAADESRYLVLLAKPTFEKYWLEVPDLRAEIVTNNQNDEAEAKYEPALLLQKFMRKKNISAKALLRGKDLEPLRENEDFKKVLAFVKNQASIIGHVHSKAGALSSFNAHCSSLTKPSRTSTPPGPAISFAAATPACARPPSTPQV